MSHFKLIAIDSIMLSDRHAAFGVSAGNTATFLCSAVASAALNAARPAGTAFTADSGHNLKWLRKFELHNDAYPDFIEFAKGRTSDRWYAHAVYL